MELGRILTSVPNRDPGAKKREMTGMQSNLHAVSVAA